MRWLRPSKADFVCGMQRRRFGVIFHCVALSVASTSWSHSQIILSEVVSLLLLLLFYCCFVLLCLSSTFPISLFWDQWNFLLIYTRVSIWIYFCSYACVDIESELIPKIGSDVNFRVSKSEEIIISWMLFSCQHIGLLSVCTLERIGNVLRTLFMCTCEW